MQGPPQDADRRAPLDAIERAAREGHGRLVAWLAARCGDLALAEDAVGDALHAALTTWPEQGVPSRPEAWLLTAARHRMVDRLRRQSTRTDGMPTLRARAERLRQEASEAAEVPFREQLPDRRLGLMLVCTHPQIPSSMHTPLILQTVLGLDAERIGSAMLVRPTTMAQRLVRAKRRIRELDLPFDVPDATVLPQRVRPLLDAIYAAYGAGWEADPLLGRTETSLAREALWLSRLLVDLLPEQAEPKGLYALIAHFEARRAARRDGEGGFVPLEEQDTDRWHPTLLREAEKALWLASRQGQAGPYQVEASIQSLHADRARTGATDWHAILALYGVLVDRYPTLGAFVGSAAAHGRVGRPGDGLRILHALPHEATARNQAFHAVRAHLLAQVERTDQAAEAYTLAAGLTADPAVRRWLLDRRARLG